MDLTGSSFEGTPHSGVIKMDGKGKYTFSNGDVYIGEFKDGMFLFAYLFKFSIYYSIGFTVKESYILLIRAASSGNGIEAEL